MKDKRIIAPEKPAAPKKQIAEFAGFLQILQEMDGAGETRREITGEVVGPFFSKAVYDCMIRIGIHSNDSNTSARRRPVQ